MGTTSSQLLCQHLPPPNFIPAGLVRRARIIDTPRLMANKPNNLRGARARGINYEAKVKMEFLRRYPDEFLPGPWFEFTSAENHRPRWCQMDGLLINPWEGVITVVEIKLRHTALAWWQLNHLYSPVVRFAFGRTWTVKTVEVVRWFDPTTSTPDKPRLRSDIAAVGDGEFAVHILAL